MIVQRIVDTLNYLEKSILIEEASKIWHHLRCAYFVKKSFIEIGHERILAVFQVERYWLAICILVSNVSNFSIWIEFMIFSGKIVDNSSIMDMFFKNFSRNVKSSKVQCLQSYRIFWLFL